MDDRRDGLDRRDPSDDGVGGWRNTILGWLWVVLMMVVGWIATDASTSRNKMTEQITQNSQHIAILEEANRNMRETLQRIEKLAEDIRAKQEDARRR